MKEGVILNAGDEAVRQVDDEDLEPELRRQVSTPAWQS